MTDETEAKRAAVLGQLLGACERRIAELEAENEHLRDGIRETVEALDRADAYDTPLYERLVALLDEN